MNYFPFLLLTFHFSLFSSSLSLPDRDKERLTLTIKHEFPHPLYPKNPQMFVRRGFHTGKRKLTGLRKQWLDIATNNVRQSIHGIQGICSDPPPGSWEKITAAAALSNWRNLCNNTAPVQTPDISTFPVKYPSTGPIEAGKARGRISKPNIDCRVVSVISKISSSRNYMRIPPIPSSLDNMTSH